jgi:hypothetical protein
MAVSIFIFKGETEKNMGVWRMTVMLFLVKYSLVEKEM